MGLLSLIFIQFIYFQYYIDIYNNIILLVYHTIDILYSLIDIVISIYSNFGLSLLPEGVETGTETVTETDTETVTKTVKGTEPGTDSREKPIDLTQDSDGDKPNPSQDKGKGKADSENQEDLRLLDYFNNLLAKRTDLTEEYEAANKLWKESDLEEDKINLDRIGIELDATHKSIEEIVNQTDLLDPADDFNSEEED